MKTKLQILVAGMFLATVGTGLGQPCITITTQPQGQTNCTGSPVTFSVVATGAEPLKYQWQQAYDLYNYVDRPEGTNATLAITNTQNLDSGLTVIDHSAGNIKFSTNVYSLDIVYSQRFWFTGAPSIPGDIKYI